MPRCQSFSSKVDGLYNKTSIQDTRVTYCVSIKTLFYLMTSVVFYPFSAEMMQLSHIHYLTVSLSVGVWHGKKKDQRINVFLYVLCIHCNVVAGIVLHDKCSDFRM